MNDYTELIKSLDDIIQLRLKYSRSWNKVVVYPDAKGTFSIKWSEYQGDPDNSARFQIATYPMEMMGQIIKEQKRKLKKDIPDTEQAILKAIL